jgi:thiamine pyrophosphokinase
MKKRFLIITNGRIQSHIGLQSSFHRFTNFILDNKSFTIICADGGIQNATQLSLKADYLIGDFDSIDRELLKEAVKDSAKTESINKAITDNTEIIYDPDQSKTDTRLAVELALKLAAEEIYIIAATGGRMDHCLSNILELKFINDKASVSLIDEYSAIKYSDKSIELNGETDETLSIIPLSDIKELSYHGLKYPLDKVNIPAGTSLICNKFSENQAKISFESGEILIIRAHEAGENAEIGVREQSHACTVAERASSRLRRTNDRNVRVISSDAEDASHVSGSYPSKQKYKLDSSSLHEDHEDDENAEIEVPRQCND